MLAIVYIAYCYVPLRLSPVAAGQRKNTNRSQLPASQAVPKLYSEPPSPQRQPTGISQVIFVLKDKGKKTIPCQQKPAKGTRCMSLLIAG